MAQPEDHSLNAKEQSTRRYVAVMTLIISLVIASSFLGFTLRTNQLMSAQLLDEARAFRQEIILLRQWVSSHQGVYVRARPGQDTKPEDKIQFQRKRYITDSDGEVFIMRNSSEVTKDLSLLSEAKGIVTFGTTSMQPINPDDMPDGFEVEGLRRLQAGEQEISAFVTRDGQSHYRYMAPFITTVKCMKCHADYGYQVGRPDGALSIAIPTSAFEQQKRANLILITLLGMAVILLVIGSIWYLSRGFMRRLAEADQRLQQMATEDSLTGLFNRRMGMNQLARDLAFCQRNEMTLALLMLDIDHFKRVNDEYGHQVGDQCIRNLADCIRQTLRAYDTAYRYGGEEFVVVLTRTDAKIASEVAERLRKLVRGQTIATGKGSELTYTVSIGVAESSHGITPDELLSQSDTALYEAKERGRDRCVVFYD